MTDQTTQTTTAVRVTVHGNVQGVFFRDSTRRQAQQHGVTGWVRNDPEGTVTAVLEGSEQGVDELVSWMRAGGPSRASVERVELEQVQPEGHRGFDVRR